MRKELSYSTDLNELKLVRNNELTKFIMDGKAHTFSDRQLLDISKTIDAYLNEKKEMKHDK